MYVYGLIGQTFYLSPDGEVLWMTVGRNSKEYIPTRESEHSTGDDYTANAVPRSIAPVPPAAPSTTPNNPITQPPPTTNPHRRTPIHPCRPKSVFTTSHTGHTARRPSSVRHLAQKRDGGRVVCRCRPSSSSGRSERSCDEEDRGSAY